MAAYFQDIRSLTVLKFVQQQDIDALRKQISDYVEVAEKDYEAFQDKFKEKRVYTKKAA